MAEVASPQHDLRSSSFLLERRVLTRDQRKAECALSIAQLESEADKALQQLKEDRERRAQRRGELKGQIDKLEDIQYVP